MDVSIILPASDAANILPGTVESLRSFLKNSGLRYEIIIVPNGINPDALSATVRTASTLSEQYPEVKTVPVSGEAGKGAAFRSGYGHSHGKWVGFTDADLPYDLKFLADAFGLLKQGADFVSGNRRLPESRFNVPVRTLRLVYRRHLLGLSFNRVIRLLLGIKTRDTQAGIKIMTRSSAEICANQIACPGFLFDVELFLTAQQYGMRMAELPVCLNLESEKSTVRLFREFLVTVVWLSRIWSHNRHGHYGPKGK